MARGPEARLVQDPLTLFLRTSGIVHKKKDTGPWCTSPGWPDLEIYPGMQRIFFIECKAPGEAADVSPIQAHVHKMLRDLGYHVYVVDDKDIGKEIIRRECKLK